MGDVVCKWNLYGSRILRIEDYKNGKFKTECNLFAFIKMRMRLLSLWSFIFTMILGGKNEVISCLVFGCKFGDSTDNGTRSSARALNSFKI